MYYFSDSPVVLTDLPSDLNSFITVTDDGQLVAVLVSNQIYFHCQKSNVLLCQYRHSSSNIERYGNLAFAAWNSTGDILLLRTDLGFLGLLHLLKREIEQGNGDNSIKLRLEVVVKSVNILQSLGQFSCCISTCNKIIAGNRVGRVICLNWLGEVLTNEGFDFHSIPVQSEFGINAVTSRLEPSVNYHRFYWAPSLGGFLVTLTNGRLILVILPLSRLDAKQVRAVYLTQVEPYSPLSVNSRFRSYAVGSSE
ncbi:unnamed protein product [Rodentolepis nana]|uniref:CNH domain-containing protein n=1 Tax=Rodentolepis nana TaxID=102285 RepID=A0A0R3T5X5_RODNA|nr:unnamed protein product [Rodentolepis nana]